MPNCANATQRDVFPIKKTTTLENPTIFKYTFLKY
jgi:hypothetical protein